MDRIEKLKAFLDENPQDSFVQHALALEHVKLGNDVAARQLFESILAREPGYTGSYYHLGKLLERIGDSEAAIRTYENGMEETKKRQEMHAYGELKGALEALTS